MLENDNNGTKTKCSNYKVYMYIVQFTSPSPLKWVHSEIRVVQIALLLSQKKTNYSSKYLSDVNEKQNN